MQQGLPQLSFELGERPRLRHTRLKFIPLLDGAREEREPIVVVFTRNGLQGVGVIGAAGASSRRDDPGGVWDKNDIIKYLI